MYWLSYKCKLIKISKIFFFTYCFLKSFSPCRSPDARPTIIVSSHLLEHGILFENLVVMVQLQVLLPSDLAHEHHLTKPTSCMKKRVSKKDGIKNSKTLHVYDKKKHTSESAKLVFTSSVTSFVLSYSAWTSWRAADFSPKTASDISNKETSLVCFSEGWAR